MTAPTTQAVELTKSKVRELFDYRDGNLFWRVKPANSVPIGSLAGYERSDGRRLIMYARRFHYAHRLIWIWHFGEAPPEVDHRDTNPRNNKIDNLRPATHSENQQNSGKRSDNTSGFKGVSWSKKDGRFKAAIKHNGRKIYLGNYGEAEAAYAAYVEAATRLHGEFAHL